MQVPVQPLALIKKDGDRYTLDVSPRIPISDVSTRPTLSPQLPSAAPQPTAVVTAGGYASQVDAGGYALALPQPATGTVSSPVSSAAPVTAEPVAIPTRPQEQQLQQLPNQVKQQQHPYQLVQQQSHQVVQPSQLRPLVQASETGVSSCGAQRTSTSLLVAAGVSEQGSPGIDESLRAKLQDLSTSFQSFDKSIEDDVRKRKELEYQRNKEILIALAKLEKTLNVETKRRTESVADVQLSIDQALGQMLNRFQSRIFARFDQLVASVENLGERCSTLERGIQQFKGELPSKLQVEATNLQRTIKELRADFDSDIRLRADRDAQCFRQLEEAGYSVDVRMQQEQHRFERCSETLQELIEEFAAADTSPEQTRRRAAVLDYIAEVRELLAAEVKVRETTDDRVVEAINEYTTTLHRSLQRASASHQ